jgi:indole-3-glycerol phosphate synthase
LIEIESIHEISKIKNIKSSLIGINNRNLKEQKINIDKSINLSNLIKNKNFIVSESGIDIKNIKKIKEATNIKTFLIGGSILNSSKTLNYINKLYNS